MAEEMQVAQTDLNLEEMILIQTLRNMPFFEKVHPHLRAEYFEDDSNRTIFQTFDKFVKQYDAVPAIAALNINLERLPKITDKQLDAAKEQLRKIESYMEKGVGFDNSYLTPETEAWVRERAVFNIFYEGAQALQEGKKEKMADVPDRLQQALAISFDFTIGHDYLVDAEARFDWYHDDTARVPFKLELFNKITRGGVPLKTLSVFMSSTTGGFKSGTMADWAAFLIANGYDVLYITLELSEEMVAQRIDANLMDMRIDDVEGLTKPLYMEKITKLRDKCPGRLIIKEYPTSGAHAGHFRFLMKELRSKQNFRPKVVFVDYLNICASMRLAGQSVNSYSYVKSIAEELRGLAVEMEFACISATQGNRGAVGSSDVSLADVSESIGLPATCDLFLGIISNEQLDQLNQITFKQLKNRFGDINYYRYMTMGVNKAKMMLYDLDQSAVRMNTGTTGGNAAGQEEIPDRPLNSFGSGERRSKFDEFQL